MGLEILKADPVMSDESDDSNIEEPEVVELSAYELNPEDDGGSAHVEDDYEDAMGDIEELISMEDADL